MTGAPQSSSILQKIQADAVGKVPSYWEIRSVGELVRSGVLDKIQDGNHGESHPVSKDYVPSGIPFLMSGSIRNGRVNIRECKFLTIEHAKSLRVGHAYRGDVLLTHKGNDLGRTAILRETDWAVLTPQITYYRVRDGRILLPEFLRYVFESPKFQHQFKRDSEQSTRPFVSISNQEKLFIPVPPAEEQQAVAHILGTLDDKIELNRRMNETLGGIALALFKSWFVDFDPVRVLSGRMPEQRPFLVKENLRKMGFPDRFQDSELGEIPSAWRIGRIKDCCSKIQNGGTPRRDQPSYWEEGEIPWLTSGEVRQSIIISTNAFITEAGLTESSAKWVPQLSTVVALYGATAGQVSLVASRLTTNQAVCALIPKKNFEFFNYLSMRAATPDLESKAIGSAQQNISKGIVEETQLTLPPHSVLEAFDGMVGNLFERWIINIREQRTLAELRDILLPKLVSGEIHVGNLEAAFS